MLALIQLWIWRSSNGQQIGFVYLTKKHFSNLRNPIAGMLSQIGGQFLISFRRFVLLMLNQPDVKISMSTVLCIKVTILT